METKYHHEVKPSASVLSVRDRIVAFHDAHLKVSPVSESALAAFEDAASVITSKKGKAVVERLRPKMEKLCKNAEVALAAGDMTLGAVGAGVGAVEFVRTGIAMRNNKENRADIAQTTASYPTEHRADKRYGRRLMKSGLLTGTGGVILAARSLSRGADWLYRRGKPLFRKIAGIYDHILLKSETPPQTAKQVFVGSSKA